MGRSDRIGGHSGATKSRLNASNRVLGVGFAVGHASQRRLELRTVTPACPRRQVLLRRPGCELLACGTRDELVDGDALPTGGLADAVVKRLGEANADRAH